MIKKEVDLGIDTAGHTTMINIVGGKKDQRKGAMTIRVGTVQIDTELEMLEIEGITIRAGTPRIGIQVIIVEIRIIGGKGIGEIGMIDTMGLRGIHLKGIGHLAHQDHHHAGTEINDSIN